jgi:hypothetical protein
MKIRLENLLAQRLVIGCKPFGEAMKKIDMNRTFADILQQESAPLGTIPLLYHTVEHLAILDNRGR